MGKSFKRQIDLDEQASASEYHEAKNRLDLDDYIPEEDDGYEDISHLIDSPKFYRTLRGV